MADPGRQGHGRLARRSRPRLPAPRAGDRIRAPLAELEDAEAVDWIGADLPIVRAVREATRAITARLTGP